MLIVISPAKNLDFQSPVKFKSVTQPLMIDQAKSLVQICKKLSKLLRRGADFLKPIPIEK